MVLCTHGTSADNLQSILEYGLLVDKPKVWCVSNDAIYCWSKRYVDIEYGENEDEEYVEEILIQTALNNCYCTLATAKDCRAVVVLFNVNEDELEEDLSCDNMNIASCIHRNIKPEEIVKVLISQDLSIIRGLFISMMTNKRLYNNQFTEFEEKLVSYLIILVLLKMI
mgnify:CR=1 FL=1